MRVGALAARPGIDFFVGIAEAQRAPRAGQVPRGRTRALLLARRGRRPQARGRAAEVAVARGVGLLACGVNGLAVGEISARAVKKAVAGTGTAEKKQVQDMVTRLLAVTAKNADAADALAIAIAASNDAGKLANVGVGSGKGKATGGLSAAIAVALARDDASNGGKT